MTNGVASHLVFSSLPLIPRCSASLVCVCTTTRQSRGVIALVIIAVDGRRRRCIWRVAMIREKCSSMARPTFCIIQIGCFGGARVGIGSEGGEECLLLMNYSILIIYHFLCCLHVGHSIICISDPNDPLSRLEQQERMAILMEELENLKFESLPISTNLHRNE